MTLGLLAGSVFIRGTLILSDSPGVGCSDSGFDCEGLGPDLGVCVRACDRSS